MTCSIKVDNIVWPSLKTIWPDFTKGQINAELSKFVSIISATYPEGHSGVYSVPGAEIFITNRPVIIFESGKWTVTSWSVL